MCSKHSYFYISSSFHKTNSEFALGYTSVDPLSNALQTEPLRPVVVVAAAVVVVVVH